MPTDTLLHIIIRTNNGTFRSDGIVLRKTVIRFAVRALQRWVLRKGIGDVVRLFGVQPQWEREKGSVAC